MSVLHPPLPEDEAMQLARDVFGPSFPWLAYPEGYDGLLGYALWNETAWPFSGDRALLRRQLEAYRDSAEIVRNRPKSAAA